MPKRPNPRGPNVPAISMVPRIREGTRPPYSEVSSALDNPALRKRLLTEMGRPGRPKGRKG